MYRTTWLTPGFVQCFRGFVSFLVLISTEEFPLSSAEAESSSLQAAKAITWSYIAAAIRVGEI
jgi:hypothetical protein